MRLSRLFFLFVFRWWFEVQGSSYGGAGWSPWLLNYLDVEFKSVNELDEILDNYLIPGIRE